MNIFSSHHTLNQIEEPSLSEDMIVETIRAFVGDKTRVRNTVESMVASMIS